MKLLIDSDVFCKLAICNLLDGTLDLLSLDIDDCCRLPALPHMLRRGKIYKTYGVGACARILPLALSIAVIPDADHCWLDLLTPVDDIDAGEAQLFAVAAQHGSNVLTGDKRALRALKDLTGFHAPLAGRIITLEAVLIHLFERLGESELRRRISLLPLGDQMLSICFSTSNADPLLCLSSYFNDLKLNLDPLLLWTH